MAIGAGAGTTVQAATRGTGPAQADAQRAVTEHILARADRTDGAAALIGATAVDAATGTWWPGGRSLITWPQLARIVRTAAEGLSRRGLRPGDTAGIFVADAASHAVAVHAVRAAGATAVPVRAAQTAADIAAQLSDCRARMLITSAELAGLAVEAAERSWVRQVFCFGEAAGTTPFGSLVSTGRPDRDPADPGRADRGRADFGRAGAGEISRDVIVATPPGGDPDVYTALLDEALAGGATVVAVPLSQLESAVQSYQAAAAITPAGRAPGARLRAGSATSPRP